MQKKIIERIVKKKFKYAHRRAMIVIVLFGKELL